MTDQKKPYAAPVLRKLGADDPRVVAFLSEISPPATAVAGCLGNAFKWRYTRDSGWRSEGIATAISYETAARESLFGAVSYAALVCWSPARFPNLQMFFLNGREILPSLVLDLESFEDEIWDLSHRALGLPPGEVEQVALMQLRDAVVERRRAFILALEPVLLPYPKQQA